MDDNYSRDDRINWEWENDTRHPAKSKNIAQEDYNTDDYTEEDFEDYPNHVTKHDLYVQDADYHHEIVATHKTTGGVVGAMSYKDDGRLWDIHVDEKHQRKGIATGMWDKAKDAHRTSGGKVPYPARSENETDAGEAFGRAMEKRDIKGRRK
jgi:GNAT superfamily N-acetyltransferase